MSDPIAAAVAAVATAHEEMRRAERAVLVAREHVGEMAIEAVEAGALVTELTDELGVSRPTLYRWMEEHRANL